MCEEYWERHHRSTIIMKDIDVKVIFVQKYTVRKVIMVNDNKKLQIRLLYGKIKNKRGKKF